MKYRPDSCVARARQAISASSANIDPKRMNGSAAAGSMRAITGNTNNRIGAAYTALAPAPASGRPIAAATIGASA